MKDKTYYKAVMDYTGYPEFYGAAWKAVEPFLSKMYVMAYNVYATGFDYRPINEEWNKMHPDIQKLEEGSEEQCDYNKFVAERATDWVEEHINKKMMANLDMRFRVEETNVDFIGYDRLHPERTVSMYLVPYVSE